MAGKPPRGSIVLEALQRRSPRKMQPRERFEDETRNGAWHVGSPETVARKIASTVHVLKLDRFDLKYSTGTIPHERLMTSIELYATEVLPRLR